MLATTQQPIKRFEIDYEGVIAWGVEKPIDAAILEMAQVIEGWDWYDVDRRERIGDLTQYWGSLYRGPLDVPSASVEVYRFYVEVTPCLVTVEVYQTGQ